MNTNTGVFMINAAQANQLLAEKKQETDVRMELMAKEAMDKISEALEVCISGCRNKFIVELLPEYGSCMQKVCDALISFGYKVDCMHAKVPGAPWVLTVSF
jgi:hypothetical protein